MEGMTIKEIAEIANVKSSAIRAWIGQTAESAGISAKTALSQGKEPVHFTLSEVINIIRAGGRETLADLLLENAKKSTDIAPPQYKEVSQLAIMVKTMVEAIPALVRSTVQETIKALPQGQPALPVPIEIDYFTITEYAITNKIKLSYGETVNFGTKASRISRSKNMEIHKVPHIKYKQGINSYHISVLKVVFNVKRNQTSFL